MAEPRFVARREQLASLHEHLHEALESRGTVTFVMGEAGAGKTALVTEFLRQAELVHGDLVVTIGNCNAQTGLGDPYLPFREILAQLTGDFEGKLAQGAMTTENARRLHGLARWTLDALMELGPDLANLLLPGSALLAKAGKFVIKQAGYPDKFKQFLERRAAGPEGAPLEQSHIFAQYTQLLQVLAKERPLVLVLDDLQWVDTASASLLFHLGRRVSESRILVLGAYRPEEVKLGRVGARHPLEKVLAELKRYYGDVWVDLDQAEVTETRLFVDALVDLEPNCLGEDFRQALARHTGGHPLFAVELLRDMQDAGDLSRDQEGRWVAGTGLDWDTLPPRVEGVIEERIGRLEANLRETLTVGSVEGEEFTAEVIARVQEVEERSLVRSLSETLDRQHRLVVSQGVRRLGTQALSSYRFRHSLFQKYLYDALDAPEKAYLHEDVGRILELLYGERAGEVAPQLGRHFREAGLTEKAVHYLGLAGEQAMRLSANAEAIGYVRDALALLQTLPASAGRDAVELPLQMGLATATIVSGGYSAPGVKTALDRARALCSAEGGADQLFPIVRSLYSHYHALGEHAVAYDLAEQLLELAQASQDPALLVITHQALGQSQGEMGDFLTARETLERGLAHYDPDRFRPLAYSYGEEHGISSRLNLACDLFVLGYPDQAMAQAREMLASAEALGHPPVLACAGYGMSTLQLLSRQDQAGLETTEAVLALCREESIPFWLATARINYGFALTVHGRPGAGIAEALQGLQTYRAIGANVLQTAYLALLADIYRLAGQVENGLAAIDEGLGAVADMGERAWEAELYRLRAQLRRMQGDDIQAEADLCRALEIARSQRARIWELRTMVDLARLRRDQGKTEEARAGLAEVFGWFTEGFGMPDLQEAKALLAELSPA